MTTLILFAVFASIGVTLLLTGVLWRLNAPARAARDEGTAVPIADDGRRETGDSDGHGDGGGD